LIAIARDTHSGRSYLTPSQEHSIAAEVDRPDDLSDLAIAEGALGVRVTLYGMRTYTDVFTNRQLRALAAFADAVGAVPSWVDADGGDEAYATALASVLGLAVGKLAQATSSQVRWNVRSTGSSKAEPAFGRHALPMVWDFAECNPFGGSVGDWMGQVDSIETAIRSLPRDVIPAHVVQRDARAAATLLDEPGLVVTDPPYFDQIGYADLSDYFYIWHRRALKRIHPDLYATIATPKEFELIEAPHRRDGDRAAAKEAFVTGFREVFTNLLSASRTDLPMIVIYAHRQEESADGEIASTGWEAMLTAVLLAGLAIVGTWPVHGTRSARQIEIGTNALASYVVLVLRPRPAEAPVTTRRDFIAALRSELPRPIETLQHANIAAVDLAQAAIGPGMQIFSRYTRVLEADGRTMTVRTALGLINQVLHEILAAREGEFDPYSRFAVDWFQQRAFAEGPYGEAETLATAKGTAVRAVERAQILLAKAGKVRLLRRDELPENWDPAKDDRLTVWEITQHLVKRLEEGGEGAAADLLRRVGGYDEAARDLAYWLFSVCEKKGWAQEALSYNALIVAWSEIARQSSQPAMAQARLEI
jgi:putative DNA methylase